MSFANTPLLRTGLTGSRAISRSIRLTLLLMLALTPLLATHLPVAAAQTSDVPSGSVIVVMRDEVQLAETTSVAEEVEATVTFGTVLNGFAAELTPEEAAELADNPSVAGIFPDNEFYLAEEYTSSLATRRVGAPAGGHDLEQGLPAAVSATIAVLDSGVALGHPALNVVGGFDAWSAAEQNSGVTDCGALTPAEQQTYEENGASTWGSTSNPSHGSSVAGIAAANGSGGVTGIAPGASIVAIRVFHASGNNTNSKLLCGLAWLQANKGRYGIDVANMSLEMVVTPGGCATDPIHQAICDVVGGGLPIVSANGNNTTNGGPMDVYPELIAVSAMNDYDGRPGGLASSKPAGCTSTQLNTADDEYATYNDAGGSDYMAPGTCMQTTTTTGYFNNFSGTSGAAPVVAGAIALYAESNPSPSDAAARGFLNGASVPNTDSDGLVGPGPSGVPMLRLGPAPVFGSITPLSGAPSSDVNYTLTGFPANATVEITWEGVDGEVLDLGTTLTNPVGEANGQIEVPDKVPGGEGQQIHFTSGNFVKTFLFETRPRIRFHEPAATPGQVVLSNGRGFAAYDTLDVFWKNEFGAFVSLGQVITTNSNGNYSNVQITVPEWAPSGTNTMRLEGQINQNTSSLVVISPGVQISPLRTTVNNWITYDLSNFPPATQGTITWTRLSGGTIDMGTFDTDEAGNATGQFRVPATPGGPNQVITFAAGGVSEEVLFEVAPRIKGLSDGVRGGEINISLRGFAKGESFVIRWRHPSGGWVNVGSGSLSNTGSANIMITVPNFAPDGNNSVRAESPSFNQQTNVVFISGGNPFDPSEAGTPTPEPTETPTPEPTETPSTIDTSALPLEAPLPIADVTDDAFTPNLRTILTDNQITTAWSATPDPNRLDARLVIDLGGLHQVSGLAWLAESGGCGLLANLEYTIDGQTWTSVDPAMIPGPIGEAYVWRFYGTNLEASQLRITIVQAEPGQNPLGCIAEVDVWGTPVTVETPTPEPTVPVEPTETPEPTVAPEEPTPTADAGNSGENGEGGESEAAESGA